MEGVADRRSAGHIAVDNIQIMDGLHAEDCKGVYCIVITHLVNQMCTVTLLYYPVTCWPKNILSGQEMNSQMSLLGSQFIKFLFFVLSDSPDLLLLIIFCSALC